MAKSLREAIRSEVQQACIEATRQALYDKGRGLVADRANQEVYSYSPNKYIRQERLSDKNNISVFYSGGKEIELEYFQHIGYTNAPEDAQPMGSNGKSITTNEVLRRFEDGEVWAKPFPNYREPNYFFQRSKQDLDQLVKETMLSVARSFDKK